MLYYGTRISENMSVRNPQGYLICKDVPIARTGVQDYLASELGLDGDTTKVVPVYRVEEEVFDKACIASFEGMPFTDNHPSGEVNTENISFLQKGHAQNIRRGTGKHKDELMADIIVTDQMVIDEIRNGKREISCGYNFVLDEENGRYYQRQIRGNHIALVEQGRAGHAVCIKDQKPQGIGAKNNLNYERSHAKMNKRINPTILARMFASFARDEDTTAEEIAEAADEIQAIAEVTDPDKASKSVGSVPGMPENTQVVDEDAPAEDKADQIIALLQQLLAQKGADAEPEEAPTDIRVMPGDEEVVEEEEEVVMPDEDTTGMESLEKLEKSLDADPVGPAEAESAFVDPEAINEQDEEDLPLENVPGAEELAGDESVTEMMPGTPSVPQQGVGDSAIRMAIDAIKPYIASLPKAQRRKAADAAVRQLRVQMGKDAKAKTNGYAKIAQAKRTATDSRATDPRDLGRKIMAKRNCNMKH